MVRGPFVSRIITALAALFLVSATPSIAFTAPTTTIAAANGRCRTTPPPAAEFTLFSSPPGSRPDLVDRTLFKAAIDRINDEIEAQYQSQKIAEGRATEEPTEDERLWLAEQARAKEDEKNFVFLVGKLDVVLPIDTQPELDLTESLGPLVLVTNVWGRTAEATGMQEFDTLTNVSVDDPSEPFSAKTKCTTLEETAGALTAAAQHAIALGKTEINLEVQRLIKGYYAPEDSV